jgi:hypothetical protein
MAYKVGAKNWIVEEFRTFFLKIFLLIELLIKVNVVFTCNISNNFWKLVKGIDIYFIIPHRKKLSQNYFKLLGCHGLFVAENLEIRVCKGGHIAKYFS